MYKPLLVLSLCFSLFVMNIQSKAEVVSPLFTIHNLDESILNQFSSKADLKLFTVAIKQYQEFGEKQIIGVEQWKSFKNIILNLKNELKNSNKNDQERIKAKLNEIESNYISIEEFLNQYLSKTK